MMIRNDNKSPIMVQHYSPPLTTIYNIKWERAGGKDFPNYYPIKIYTFQVLDYKYMKFFSVLQGTHKEYFKISECGLISPNIFLGE
jgi:hypothetical protein